MRMLMQIIIRGLGGVFLCVCVCVRLCGEKHESKRAGLIKYQSQVPWENVAVSFMKLCSSDPVSLICGLQEGESSRGDTGDVKVYKLGFWNSAPRCFQVVYKVKKKKSACPHGAAPILYFIRNKLEVLIIDSFSRGRYTFSYTVIETSIWGWWKLGEGELSWQKLIEKKLAAKR